VARITGPETAPSLFDVAAERIAAFDRTDAPLSQVRLELEHGDAQDLGDGLFAAAE
jgi:hypothetical protein